MRVAIYDLDDLNASPCCFNGGFCFSAGGIHAERDLAFQFAITEDLHAIILAYKPVDIKILQGEFLDIIFLHEVFHLAEIENLVLNTVNVIETALGDPALDGHLAAFVRHLILETGTALCAFGTFRGCSSVPGTVSASNSFYFMGGSFRGP